MTCPEKLQVIYRKELERQKEKDLHPRLLYRKDTRDKKTRMKRIRPEMEHRVLQEWYNFHCQLNHEGYQDFYSKILFCLNKDLVSKLDMLSFMQLIADRRFLFLDYNENYSLPEYPPLSEIVHAPNYYLRPSDFGDKQEYQIILRLNAETVLQQAFVPTSGHQSAWEEWNAHLEELQNAYALQKKLVKKYGAKKMEAVEIQIEPALQMPLTKREEKLCGLFRKYVEACYEYAYAEDMKEVLGRRKYYGIIQYVDHYLRTNYTKDRVFHVLVFFHLFSQQMKRVAKGSLRKYRCKPLEPSKLKNQRPAAVQSTVRTRVECNIKLFDYLMELLLFDGDKDLSRKAREKERDTIKDAEQIDNEEIEESLLLPLAKYRFRLFTRYDQYCHYDLRKKYKYDETTGGVELQIDFCCRENLKDGVDLFGNLLRYHIKYCMPNQVQWLQPFITPINFTPVLATLLLDDGQILPTRERLTDRIRLAIANDEKSLKKQTSLTTEELPTMVNHYQKHFLDQEQLRIDLEKWCEKLDFHFRHESALYERDFEKDSLETQAAARCGRVVLDYALREELIRRAEKNLLARAEKLFGDMCHHEEEEKYSS